MHYNNLSLLSIWVDGDMLQVIEDAVQKHVEDTVRAYIMDLENLSERLTEHESDARQLKDIIKKMDAMSQNFKNTMTSTSKVIEEILYKKPHPDVRIPL